jgi:hypothetical protein
MLKTSLYYDFFKNLAPDLLKYHYQLFNFNIRNDDNE